MPSVLKSRIALPSLLVLALTPFFWRLGQAGGTELIGLLSDGGVGVLVFLFLLYAPHWLRVILAILWAAFSIGAQELVTIPFNVREIK